MVDNNTYPYIYPIYYYRTTRRYAKAETGQNRRAQQDNAQNRLVTSVAGQNRIVVTTVDSGKFGEL